MNFSEATEPDKTTNLQNRIGAARPFDRFVIHNNKVFMNCEYVQQYYNVPACIGRRVTVDGKPGIIAKDCGHYIGVNFDADKPGIISHCHPTWKVEYGDIGKVRKPSKYAARYQRYLEYGDCFDSFIDFCRWDADPERSWNGGV